MLQRQLFLWEIGSQFHLLCENLFTEIYSVVFTIDVEVFMYVVVVFYVKRKNTIIF